MPKAIWTNKGAYYQGHDVTFRSLGVRGAVSTTMTMSPETATPPPHQEETSWPLTSRLSMYPSRSLIWESFRCSCCRCVCSILIKSCKTRLWWSKAAHPPMNFTAFAGRGWGKGNRQRVAEWGLSRKSYWPGRASNPWNLLAQLIFHQPRKKTNKLFPSGYSKMLLTLIFYWPGLISPGHRPAGQC